jgi:hypothetical protein
MKRLLSLSLLALAPLTTGCFYAAAAGAGFIVSQQVLPGKVQETRVQVDVDRAWPKVQETLAIHQSPGTEMQVNEAPRRIMADVNGATVVVEVEAFDLGVTTLRVSAEKYYTRDLATAQEVMNSITARLREPQ